ncbi:hypothetical protein B0H14DRAFT_3473875 [Mycena olivaceomarginata]|nr:hypothetical protein B0H14DRAFT_3473875 [Mycena olivaceomarginata]
MMSDDGDERPRRQGFLPAPFVARALHSVLFAMEAFVGTFQVQLADAGSSPTFSDTSAGSSVFSGSKPLFRTVADPGSFLADSTGGKFSLSWDHWAGFQAW